MEHGGESRPQNHRCREHKQNNDGEEGGLSPFSTGKELGRRLDFSQIIIERSSFKSGTCLDDTDRCDENNKFND